MKYTLDLPDEVFEELMQVIKEHDPLTSNDEMVQKILVNLLCNLLKDVRVNKQRRAIGKNVAMKREGIK